MKQVVFFLEEKSAKEFLKALLPFLWSDLIERHYFAFEGKQDLEKQLVRRIKFWGEKENTETFFVVMRDQDSGDCKEIKDNLLEKCRATGKKNTIVRIACRELESFFIGDLNAVAQAFGKEKLIGKGREKKFRDPDRLASPSAELKKLIKDYEKTKGARTIAPFLLANAANNKSHSFQVLLSSLRQLA